jgi:hypothetical protein
MVFRILLLAGDDADTALEVSRTVVLEPLGPQWQSEIVTALGAHARDTARCLVDQMHSALPDAPAPAFVPLAQLLQHD